MAAEAPAEDKCAVFSDDMANANNPGRWAPAVAFGSQQVRPGAIHPPNKTDQTGTILLPGICDSALFSAESFAWWRPTSDGGDWIANVTAKTAPMQINVDGELCPLTHIALTTTGWPNLRLQFETCPTPTAVQVPLANSSSNGFKLVHWMCQVLPTDSKLCADANADLPADQQQARWASQKSLDLTLLAQVAAKGVNRMRVYSECFRSNPQTIGQNWQSINWIAVSSMTSAGLGVDFKEWEMMMAIRKRLAPASHPTSKVPSYVLIETLCIPDCAGNVDPECLPPVEPTLGPPLKATWPNNLADFAGDFSATAVLPWFVFFFGITFVFFTLCFSGIAMCCFGTEKAKQFGKPKLRGTLRDSRDPNASHTILLE